MSNRETALAVGVSLSTVEKWKQRTDFQELLQDAVLRIYRSSVAELALGVMDSSRELRRIITDPDVSERVKISAIGLLFSQLNNFKNWHLEQRLELLEQAISHENETENSVVREEG